MNRAIILVRPKSALSYANLDPWIHDMHSDCVELLELDSEHALDNKCLEKRILTSVRNLREQGVATHIVIHAFLDANTPGFTAPRTWNPSRDDLKRLTAFLTGGSKETGLTSLRLMWSLWRKLRSEVSFLISLNGIIMSSEARMALEVAFSAGRSCEMYDWDSYSAIFPGKERAEHERLQRVAKWHVSY